MGYNACMKNAKIYPVYVGNLNYNVNEVQLFGLFKEFGFIENIKILQKGKNNINSGVAFVNMVNLQDAQKAVKALDQTFHRGRTLKVSLSKSPSTTIRSNSKPEAITKPQSKTSEVNNIKKQRRLGKATDFKTLFKPKK